MVNCSIPAFEPVDDVLGSPSSLSCARSVGGGGIRDGGSIEVGVSRVARRRCRILLGPADGVSSRPEYPKSSPPSPFSPRRLVSRREREKTNVVNTGCGLSSKKRVAFRRRNGVWIGKKEKEREKRKNEKRVAADKRPKMGRRASQRVRKGWKQTSVS